MSRTQVAPVTAVRQAAAKLAAGIAQLPQSEQRRGLADSGYVAPAWPPPYGLAATPAAQLLIDDELGRAGAGDFAAMYLVGGAADRGGREEEERRRWRR